MKHLTLVVILLTTASIGYEQSNETHIAGEPRLNEPPAEETEPNALNAPSAMNDTRPQFHLQGEFAGINSGTLVIRYDGVKKECEIVDGKFNLLDKISHPTLASIWIKPKSNVSFFYLDKGEISLTGSVEEASTTASDDANSRVTITQVSGSHTEDLRQDYHRFYQQSKKLADFQTKLFRYLDSRISKERKNPFWGTVVAELAVVERVLNQEQLLTLSRQLDSEAMTGDALAMLESGLSANSRFSIGDEFPEFELLDINGALVGPKKYRGKFLLVDFWASWCSPCRAKHRVLAGLKPEERLFEILSISIDDEPLAWRKAIQEDNLFWANILDHDKQISKQLAIVGLPASFLLDKSGKILAVNMSLEEIKELTKQ